MDMNANRYGWRPDQSDMHSVNAPLPTHRCVSLDRASELCFEVKGRDWRLPLAVLKLSRCSIRKSIDRCLTRMFFEIGVNEE